MLEFWQCKQKKCCLAEAFRYRELMDFRLCARGRPFGSTPLEETDPECANKNAEAVGNALVSIACAILALVLVKRVHRIRFI